MKLYLQKVKIDRQGYDGRGKYWGVWAPGTPGKHLYNASSDNGDVDLYLRADDRLDAEVQVLKQYPNAKFLRP